MKDNEINLLKQNLWLMVATCIAYCVNKELYKAIDYLREQVRVLVEQQEKQGKRILLTNKQRMRIAAKAKKLSRKMLEKCTELYTPDTILGWYRKLIAQKYNGIANRKKIGRPRIAKEVVILALNLKKDNPRWGYKKITDQIVYLGHKISKSAVKNILIEHGFNPEPDLTVRSSWHEFLKSHWNVFVACDFFTVELMIGRKLVRCTLFFVIELATRKVSFLPVKPQPDGDYMRQVARILTDCEDGFLKGKRFLIHDRDPLFKTEGFYDILEDSGIEPIRLPAQSPDLNAYAERFVKSIKSECLDYLILSSVKQLEYVIREYCDYYHHERIHQSLGRIIEPKHKLDDNAEIQRIERLGGLLKSYHRLAA